jgi:hypothetical protein
MIAFSKSLDESKLLMAYNNNIIEFNSDSSLIPLNAEIKVGLNDAVIIYPQPNGVFYYNLKELIKTLINTNNFADNVIDVTLAYEFYNWTNNVYNNDEIEIKINFIDTSSETTTINPTWLSGYLQLNNRRPIHNDELFVMLPQNISTKTSFLKYWIGYPMDLSIYNDKFDLFDFSFVTDFGTKTFEDTHLVTRFSFSDGANNPICNVINPDNLEFITIYPTTDDTPRAIINFQQVTPKCDNGFYIKWINSFGGYSYWLFENWELNQSTKDLGELNNDNANLLDTLSKTIQIGKTSQNRVNVTTDVINENEQLLLSDLIDSPKIYWFIGTPNEVNNFNDWTEISLVTSNIPLTSTKRNLNKFNLTFELPANDTRTL